MTTSPYDILFEPVQIGPKTTRNRFYRCRIAPAWAFAIPVPRRRTEA